MTLKKATIMNEQYQFFAFISYKREDKKWAKWLQHRLEHYKLPLSIRKKNINIPRHIRPIFRDQSELSSGPLVDSITNGLNSSKYLIVICSPNSAKSPWVCKEVQHFIDTGRQNCIIPFIIDGEPHSSDQDKECYPKSLLAQTGENEILGINAKEDGRDAAMIKVISHMLGLDFDSLWQRNKKEKRRKNAIRLIASVSIALFLLASGHIHIQQRKQIAIERIINLSNEVIKNIEKQEIAEGHRKLLQADSIYITLPNSTRTTLSEYEYALRMYSRYFEKPGINPILIMPRPDSLISCNYGWLANDNEIRYYSYDPSNRGIGVSWKYLNNSYSIKSNPYDESKYLWDSFKHCFSTVQDDKFVTCNNDSIIVIDIHKDQYIGRPIIRSKSIFFAMFDCIGENLIILEDSSTLLIGDYYKGTMTPLQKFNHSINCLRPSPKNKDLIVLSCPSDSTVITYNMYRNCIIHKRKMGFPPYGVEFSPNGSRVLVYGERMELLNFGLETIYEVGPEAITDIINHASFSPSGKRIYTESSTIGVWTCIEDHYTYQYAISKDGKYSVRKDFKVNPNKYFLWDKKNKERLLDWEIPSDCSTIIGFNHNSTHLLYSERNAITGERIIKDLDITNNTIKTITSDTLGMNYLLNNNATKLISYLSYENIIEAFDIGSKSSKSSTKIPFSNIAYNSEKDNIILSSGHNFIILSMNLTVIDSLDIQKDIKAFTLNDQETSLYYYTADGTVCKLDLKTKRITDILKSRKPDMFTNIGLSIDSNEKYLIITWDDFYNKYTKKPDDLPIDDYRQQTFSTIEILDIETKKIVEDLTPLRGRHASWIIEDSDFKHINIDNHIIDFKPIPTLIIRHAAK